MMPDLSPEAQERARRTIMVAAVFDEHADEIEAAIVEVSVTARYSSRSSTPSTSSPGCTGSRPMT